MDIRKPRRSIGHVLRAIAALAAAGLVGGCGSVEDTYADVAQLWSTPIVLPCPTSKIIGGLERRIHFREGPGRDLTDIMSESRIGDIRLACVTKIDKETREGVMEIDMLVVFGAKRGPANKSRHALLPYFITVTDQKRNVLYYEKFIVDIAFEGNQTTVQFVGEPIKLELPLSKKIGSGDYMVFTGFKLTKDQLEHNHRLKGRGHL